MSDNPYQALCQSMRTKVPGFKAAGIFGFEDGLMLGVDSDFPDTNRDHMSGSHVRIFDRMRSFLTMLPESIAGQMHSVVLDLASHTFFMTMDHDHTLVVMVACDVEGGNLGMLRVISKQYLDRALNILHEP
ncbi:MAG: hypothetical protein AAGA48_35055 [Myxococcota bacterium]